MGPSGNGVIYPLAAGVPIVTASTNLLEESNKGQGGHLYVAGCGCDWMR